MTAQTKTEKDRVVIFDTTLRDGEQSPGATMTLEEKLEIAELLDEMGVDIIEAGFPIASDGDFEAVLEIAKRVEERDRLRPRPRHRQGHRPRRRGGAHAERRRIHTFIGTSPLHRAIPAPARTEDEVLEIIIAHGDAGAQPHRRRRVVGDGRDPDRARLPLPVVETAIKAGATTINIPDTVGYAVPDEYRDHDRDAARPRARSRQGDLLDPLPQRPRPGDRQLAGRRRGGRAADRMHDQRPRRARRQRRARRGRDGDEARATTSCPSRPASTRRMLMRASQLVSAVPSFPVQYNKAIVGKNAFAHESGIHQDGMLKNAQTYEIMTPEMSA